MVKPAAAGQIQRHSDNDIMMRSMWRSVGACRHVSLTTDQRLGPLRRFRSPSMSNFAPSRWLNGRLSSSSLIKYSQSTACRWKHDRTEASDFLCDCKDVGGPQVADCITMMQRLRVDSVAASHMHGAGRSWRRRLQLQITVKPVDVVVSFNSQFPLLPTVIAWMVVLSSGQSSV